MDAVTAFGPAGAAVVIVFLFLKFIRDETKTRDKREERFAKTITSNTKVSQQTYQLLKNLNGELKKAAQRKLDKLGNEKKGK